MSETVDPATVGDGWEAEGDEAAQGGTLTLSFESWEGPLDLLLTLARGQKVDLREISILALVEQYLVFIDNARELKLEVAADYLVMAAWLAYLKSALLLPRAEQPDPSPDELALRLQLRLQRLDAMREAGARLMARDLMGRDVFARGDPEGLHRPKTSLWQTNLYELIASYGQVKVRNRPVVHIVAMRNVMTLETAIERLANLIGRAIDWTELVTFLPSTDDPELAKSARASSFVAALELAKQRRLDIRQADPFSPLYLRVAASEVEICR